MPLGSNDGITVRPEMKLEKRSVVQSVQRSCASSDDGLSCYGVVLPGIILEVKDLALRRWS